MEDRTTLDAGPGIEVMNGARSYYSDYTGVAVGAYWVKLTNRKMFTFKSKRILLISL
jgi:hypothetical protein